MITTHHETDWTACHQSVEIRPADVRDGWMTPQGVPQNSFGERQEVEVELFVMFLSAILHVLDPSPPNCTIHHRHHRLLFQPRKTSTKKCLRMPTRSWVWPRVREAVCLLLASCQLACNMRFGCPLSSFVLKPSRRRERLRNGGVNPFVELAVKHPGQLTGGSWLR